MIINMDSDIIFGSRSVYTKRGMEEAERCG
jgi:hypothetical protein